MTVAESIQSIVPYPIAENTIQKICVLRGLDGAALFTQSIGISPAYQLCEADIYMYMYTAPDLREQQVSITPAERQNYLNRANALYEKVGEGDGSGTYGYIGENFND